MACLVSDEMMEAREEEGRECKRGRDSCIVHSLLIREGNGSLQSSFFFLHISLSNRRKNCSISFPPLPPSFMKDELKHYEGHCISLEVKKLM